jgi:hypothetical protein
MSDGEGQGWRDCCGGAVPAKACLGGPAAGGDGHLRLFIEPAAGAEAEHPSGATIRAAADAAVAGDDLEAAAGADHPRDRRRPEHRLRCRSAAGPEPDGHRGAAAAPDRRRPCCGGGAGRKFTAHKFTGHEFSGHKYNRHKSFGTSRSRRPDARCSRHRPGAAIASR